MANYDFVLLDVDDTLIDFALSERQGIKHVFRKFDLPFDEDIYRTYRRLNIELWESFERGDITKEDLLRVRFERLFEIYDLSADIKALNKDYQMSLGTNIRLIPNAMKVCKELNAYCTLAIVTNGTIAAQKNKLRNSGLDRIIPYIFISDELKYGKPDPRFFEHVFSIIKADKRDRVLIVGDSLGSDIKGGNNAGIHTCWYNPNKKELDQDVKINYEITDLQELRNIILNKY